jgi:hypothetical protein
MAIQPTGEPLVITELGLISRIRHEYVKGSDNTGRYRLSIVRAEDGQVITSAEIDMSQGHPDHLGFKYAKLPAPVRLEAVSDHPVVVHPRGLIRTAEYDVRCAKADYRARRTGADLMETGVAFATVQPGELIFLNLPKHPGAGTDQVAPAASSHATKRIGTNLGIQGVEVQWTAASDDNWISYYEILRDGAVEARAAKGTFYFDYAGDPRQRINSRYEVRTVDGDGNRSGPTAATLVAGEPATYRALGGYGPAQGGHQWRYEEALVDETCRPLRWTKLGYEGLWSGSGLARIGRIWMQPGAASDVARVFVVPEPGALTISGSIRKDPSAMNGRTIGVKVLHNDRQIWPANGWAGVESGEQKTVECRLEGVAAAAGDVIRFVARRTGQESADPILWDPIIVLAAAKGN